MFSRHLLLTWLFTGLVICLQPCHAQDTGKASLRFLLFPKSKEPVKLQLALGGKQTIDIEAPSNWLSPPVSVALQEVWAVGETSDGPDGKPVFKELGRAKAPASSEQILLLVRKGRDNAAGFDLIALDARLAGFGAGQYLFMNAAKVDIAGVVGEQKFVVKPGQHTIVKPKAPKDEETIYLALYFRKDDEAKPFFSSEWRLGLDARTLIFFYHDPQTAHIRLHSIKDYLR